MRHRHVTLRQAVCGLAVLCMPACGSISRPPAATPADDLERGFRHPPASARPWVYWFPLDGNLTREGITADLEAMRRVGIGGVLYMETDQGAPRGPAGFAKPLWRELIRHACAEAHRLGLEINMNNDAGWCGSGGPWITPELSMQRVVWTETEVAGPRRFDAVLAQPKATANYYRDIAVFAYPTPASPYVIPHFRGKSAEVREEIPPRASYPPAPADAVIPRDHILDLTARLGPEGRLAWDVPEGKWTLLRLGHTSTGKDNHPAPVDGRGLECDKLNPAASEAMFDGLMGKLIADSPALVGEGKTLVSTHIDSWEVGSQNWTPRFREEFRRRRGYDPLPLLPAMRGLVVDGREISERFLWDVRQTVSDLLVEHYAGRFRELARRHGMRLSIEAYDGTPCDDLTFAGRADEPMAEFWSWDRFGAAYSCTEMASAAHVYGKPILGAEAFTATDGEKWLGHPAAVKDLGDWAFCEGVNRFVFHRYALQPWPDRRPGMSMGPWGLHYERTQTWWEQSAAWHAYLARCQFLLRQGLFVADLCFLAPEMSPQRFRSPVKSGRDRPGYNFDGCPPEVVLARMTVRDGRLTLPDGMSYRMLVLPQVETMTPALLRRIRELVAAGAAVAGSPPVKSPSLSGYPACDGEVRALAGELWGIGEAPAAITERPFGRGRIFWGGELRRKPDLPRMEASNPLGSAKWIWSREGNPAAAAPPGRRCFRRIVTVDAASPVASARLTMTADNSFECWVNGRRAGAGDQFNRTYTMDVARLLVPGANLVAVSAVNASDSPNPAGLIGTLALRYRDGRTEEVHTDSSWQAAETVRKDWTTDPAPADGWTAALELGPQGMAPWGDIREAPPENDPIPDVNILCRLLARTGVPPDFKFRAKRDPQALRYIHRVAGDTDLFFVANKNPQPEETLCTFRVSGRRPELWWPETGRVEPAAAYDEADGATTVPIRFEPSGSVFVVFCGGHGTEKDRITSVARNGETLVDVTPPGPGKPSTAETARVPESFDLSAIELARGSGGGIEARGTQPGTYVLKSADGRSRELTAPSIPVPLNVDGPWDVSFAPGWGAPERVTLDPLISWSEHADPGVRYFSGAAVYRKTLRAPDGWPAKDRRLFLDLGRVEVIAEVKLNGKHLGTLWKPPFRADVTDALKAGDNALEVNVVNLWINRMIGDEQLPEDSDRNPNGTLKSWPQWLQEGRPSPTGRFTFTSWRLWKKDSPLQPSGLLGPVTLRSAVRVALPP